jgi:hypothetical protein
MRTLHVVFVVLACVLLCAGAIAVLPACGEDSCDVCEECGDAGDAGTLCTPGASQACTCTDGSSGAQVCAGDGMSFESCICASPDGDADVDTDVDGDADSDADDEPADCPFAGRYSVDGEISFCHGCEWSPFTGEIFEFAVVPGGATVTFDGFTHGPLMVDEGASGTCIVHGSDSWTEDEYIQGNEAYSGSGTYHFNFTGDGFRGLFSWVITTYVDGVATIVDCEVTYRVTGTRI